MTTDDLIKHFGSATKAYRALGVSPQLWCSWERAGISTKRQAVIQLQLDGVLLMGAKKPAKRFRGKVAA